MTPEERYVEISNALYMGEVPDIWETMAKVLVTRQIRAAEKEAILKCAMIVDSYGLDGARAAGVKLSEVANEIRKLSVL